MKTKKKAAKKSVKKVVVKPFTKTEEKRVIIIKDAISQLNLEVYKAEHDGYVNLDSKVDTLTDDYDTLNATCKLLTGKDASKIELKEVFSKVINQQQPCGVCLRGALLLSSIRKFNNYPLSEIGKLDTEAQNITANIFGEKNAELMENYYEGTAINRVEGHDDYDDNGDSEYSRFEDKYPNLTERLIVILKNALKNRGTFKPEQLN